MNKATVAQTAMSLAMLLILLGFLIWGMRTEQFRGTEETRYAVFRDHEMDEVLREEKEER